MAGFMAWACFTPARLWLDGAGVHVSYRPFHRVVPWSQIESIVRGERVDSVGFGWRWEGKGRTAARRGARWSRCRAPEGGSA